MAGIEAIVSLDIDGTQYAYGDQKCDADSLKLKRMLEDLRDEGKIVIIHNTGRPFPWVCHGSPVPRYLNPIIARPDYLISHAGTVIWDDFTNQRQLKVWRDRIMGSVSVEDVKTFLDEIENTGLQIDEESFGNEFKVCVKTSPAEHARVVSIIKDMAHKTFPGKFDVLFWNNTSVDITPKDINKRTALDYLLKEKGLEGVPVIVGGDSMNDSPLLTNPLYKKIVVGNALGELKKITEGIADVFQASADKVAAAGVLAGLEHFGLMQKRPSVALENKI